MIRLTEKGKEIIDLEIKMNFVQIEIVNFLQKKGYEIKGFTMFFPAVEEMLVSEPAYRHYTITATKPGEKQSENNHYLHVFEKELKNTLKEFK
ncbi:hypothetical protein OK18_19190 [Chryseobacterium gallinarum]|uniref:Uncharacterized protein n=1 Tax=Chryseobacterium gallinarum TaxID=1324352 RepID=A0A0G3MBH2_CHRGL|nr:hypothetical protein [Chryseobacterium gallinarum]AKK74457.1 hypothetical protein OK18_19190 [Chryseobacterium gallinarum]